MLMAGAVVARVMIPLYRDHPPAGSGQRAAGCVRAGPDRGVLLALAAVALAGEPLVQFFTIDAIWRRGRS
jgi:hypothetical protein